MCPQSSAVNYVAFVLELASGLEKFVWILFDDLFGNFDRTHSPQKRKEKMSLHGNIVNPLFPKF